MSTLFLGVLELLSVFVLVFSVVFLVTAIATTTEFWEPLEDEEEDELTKSHP